MERPLCPQPGALVAPARVLALGRAPEFSPRHVEADAAILVAVADHLGERGIEVRCVSEADWLAGADADAPLPDVVLSMGRRLATCLRLEQMERRGCRVLNRPQGVRHVLSRELTFDLLSAAGIPVPAYWAYDPEDDRMFQTDAELCALLPAWVKSSTGHGAGEQDVAFAATALEADALVLERIAKRVPDVVVMSHAPGDLVKAYVVLEPGAERVALFHWFYPQRAGYSKYGLERHNDALRFTPFDDGALRHLGLRIAQATGLEIFGFDAVIGPDGQPSVIDVNDWPSFSPCREAAAGAIVRLLCALPQPAPSA